MPKKTLAVLKRQRKGKSKGAAPMAPPFGKKQVGYGSKK